MPPGDAGDRLRTKRAQQWSNHGEGARLAAGKETTDGRKRDPRSRHGRGRESTAYNSLPASGGGARLPSRLTKAAVAKTASAASVAAMRSARQRGDEPHARIMRKIATIYQRRAHGAFRFPRCGLSVPVERGEADRQLKAAVSRVPNRFTVRLLVMSAKWSSAARCPGSASAVSIGLPTSLAVATPLTTGCGWIRRSSGRRGGIAETSRPGTACPCRRDRRPAPRRQPRAPEDRLLRLVGVRAWRRLFRLVARTSSTR